MSALVLVLVGSCSGVDVEKGCGDVGNGCGDVSGVVGVGVVGVGGCVGGVGVSVGGVLEVLIVLALVVLVRNCGGGVGGVRCADVVAGIGGGGFTRLLEDNFKKVHLRIPSKRPLRTCSWQNTQGGVPAGYSSSDARGNIFRTISHPSAETRRYLRLAHFLRDK